MIRAKKITNVVHVNTELSKEELQAMIIKLKEEKALLMYVICTVCDCAVSVYVNWNMK